MGIALFTLCFACVCGMWYFAGRNSIYNKLKADYRGALKLIVLQQAIIEAYIRKCGPKETEEENGEQD